MEQPEPAPEPGLEPEPEPEPEHIGDGTAPTDAEVRWLYGPPVLRETYCDDALGLAGEAARGLLGGEGLSSYSFSNEPPDAPGRGRRRRRRVRASGESSFTLSRCGSPLRLTRCLSSLSLHALRRALSSKSSSCAVSLWA